MSDITVKVTAPDGLPAPTLSLSFKPETAEQFEAIVDACGGALEFKIGYGGDSVYTHLADKTYVHVEPPKDAQPVRPVKNPFIAAFERRQREAKEFRDRLEAAA